MAYSEKMVERIREMMLSEKKVEEKKMFGGICFMVNDKMCIGVNENEIMCRIDPVIYEEALEMKGAREMTFTGRAMKGYVFVDNESLKSKKDLEKWVNMCLDFNVKSKKHLKRKSKRVMDFGKVDEVLDLESIDFTLPKDPKGTTEVLKKGKGKTKFYVGCAKWGRKDWIGKLYPKGTKEKDFLAHYATQFNSIEFNGFFYSPHSKEVVQKWANAVPKDFLFCPKFTQTITHLKRLKNTKADVDAYLEIVSEFGKKLGPIFLLPHPQMAPKNLDTIEEFISDVPKDVDMFLELRHGGWYESGEGYDPALFEFLRKKERGTVITDAAGRRDCVHMHLSTPECFIRFVGNGLHPTDYTRIDEWVKRIKKWMKEGLETCYFFMHQHEELHSPELIKYLIEQLNKHCKTDIKPPVMHTDGGLFD